MVVQGILALALALPTGLLFGVGYGTGVRIGYEQVYPLLFPQDVNNRNVTPTVENIKRINTIYNAIGGKEASQMGIASGLAGAMEEINRNPDFQALEALELRLSGRTQSRLGKDSPLKEISISDFPLGSSLDSNSPNFDPEYFAFIQKQKGDQPFPIGFDFGDKSKLNTFAQEKLRASIPSTKTLSIASDAEWKLWSRQLGGLKGDFRSAKREYLTMYDKIKNVAGRSQRTSVGGWRNRMINAYSKMFRISKQITQMSNQYRHKNSNIRENAIRLRKEIQQGLYKRKRLH